MSFTEKTKNEVMQKAGYCCCVCHNPSVSLEIHHIIPEAQGGGDTIENAAPLCSECHSNYGANPEKRKRIKQMRDWWYKTVEKMYSRNITNPKQLNGIHRFLQFMNAKQDSILKKQDKHDSDLENLKVQLRIISNNIIDNITPVTSDVTTSAILGTAALSISETSKKINCSKCGDFIDVRHDFCPVCGQYMG